MDQSDLFWSEESPNPLDGVEELLSRQKWTFSRMNRDELFLEVKGRRGVYRIAFTWDENLGAMQFCCEFDLRLADSSFVAACTTINRLNNRLWMGHFDLDEEGMIPCFRHTQLFRGLVQTSGADYLADLIEFAMDQCDDSYAIFQMLASSSSSSSLVDEETLSLALMPSLGSS